MQWTEAIKEYLHFDPIEINEAVKQKIYNLIDLTNLKEGATHEDILTLCAKAQSIYGHVAGVCVLPQFVRLVATNFIDTPIRVVSVANFPEGSMILEEVLVTINGALEDGAHEIDVVFPYHRYLAGERQYAQNFVTACKAACGQNLKLKMILETGTLADPAIIADATYDALAAGADFIKTSTGRVGTGATLEAAAVILLVIKHFQSQIAREVGIKISGGIHDPLQAAQYLELTDKILGRDWVSPTTFRFGASHLMDKLIVSHGLD